MKPSNQKKIWNLIAPEWTTFRSEPLPEVKAFLKTCSGKILDAGSGSGRHLQKVKEGIMYEVDFSPAMLEFAQKKGKAEKIKAEYIQAPLTKLPFKKDFFNGAITIASVHCLQTKKERVRAMKEIYRVLKPGARALITVWNKKAKRFLNGPKERLIAWKDAGERYYYLFDIDEIKAIALEEKFEVKKCVVSGDNILLLVQK